ncbi:6-phosphogluconolactonase [Jatrophihabitans sp. YIM 134969]
MSAPEPVLEVSETPDALAASVSDRLVALVVAAQQARGSASLVVTGGRVMKQVLTSLASADSSATGIDWSAVDVWWGDERWVESGSSDRNDLEFQPVADAAPFDPARIHRMPAVGDFATVEDAADAYAEALAASARDRGDDGPVPAFDVALLGVGEDGHCASLFPGNPGTSVSDRAVIAVHDSPKPPPVRLSLTFPTLDAAAEIWFVTAGDGKADAVAAALTGGSRPTEVPSSAPRGRVATRWLVDAAAAAQLPADFPGR